MTGSDNEPPHRYHFLEAAVHSHQIGDLQSALKGYLRYLKEHPSHAEVLHTVSGIYYQLDDTASAIKYLARAAKIDPDNPDYWNDLGGLYLAAEKHADAESCFREALTRRPRYLQVKNNLGLVLFRSGKIDEAIVCFREVIAQEPQFVDAHYNLGVALQQSGQLELATGAYEAAVRIRPELAVAHYNLGQSYCRKCDLENAVKAYEAAIAIDGSEGEVGRLARERLDEIEAIVEKGGVSLSTYIRNGRIFDRGFLALQEGRFQAAIDLFAQVLATQNDHVQSYGNMGLAYAILGNRQKALECLDKAIELDPGYEPAIVNRLSVQRLKDGEALPDFDPRELNYYSEFKLRGKSYVQHLVDELKAGGK